VSASRYRAVMAFPTRLLIEGEELKLDTRPHWIALFMPVLVTVVAFILATWAYAAFDVPWWVPWGLFLIVVFVFALPRFLNWWTSIFVVTSERIIHRSGWISKYSMEVPLEAINDVRFEQGIIDRMVGAGTLVIQSASEQGREVFEDIRHPEEVQKLIYHEGEKNKKRMYQGDHADAPSAPAAQSPPPAPPAPVTPAAAPSVTTELERLADLRAKGVLTEEEFQAQKARILGQG
jgi:membrane protein YdbS with pleckstrin-like domain